MTGIKGKILGLSLATLLVVSLTGCKFNVSTVNNYLDADKYIAGDTTYNAEGISKIDISWINGEIKVVQTEGSELKIDENSDTLSDKQKVHSYVKGDTLLIKYCESGYVKHIEPDYKMIVIEVPANCEFHIDTVSSDIRVGNIDATGIKVNSVSGSLIGDNVTTGDLDFNSTSGDINITDLVADSLNSDTVSGNVTAPSLQISSIDVDTVSGDVTIGAKSFSSFDMDTVSGDAVISVPEGFGMTVDKDAVSGKLRSALDYEKKGDSFVFGDGTAIVSFNSTSGNLTLK